MIVLLSEAAIYSCYDGDLVRFECAGSHAARACTCPMTSHRLAPMLSLGMRKK